MAMGGEGGGVIHPDELVIIKGDAKMEHALYLANCSVYYGEDVMPR